MDEAWLSKAYVDGSKHVQRPDATPEAIDALFFPLIVSLDFGLSPTEVAIWFGILTLVVVEVGLITPPIGMNVFIIHRLSGSGDMAATFKGVVPFLVSDVVRIALLVAFPAITLVFV